MPPSEIHTISKSSHCWQKWRSRELRIRIRTRASEMRRGRRPGLRSLNCNAWSRKAPGSSVVRSASLLHIFRVYLERERGGGGGGREIWERVCFYSQKNMERGHFGFYYRLFGCELATGRRACVSRSFSAGSAMNRWVSNARRSCHRPVAKSVLNIFLTSRVQFYGAKWISMISLEAKFSPNSINP